jgi:histidinol-phosphate/aromatic aminotransferase/cobyric acid decarboxylase-like protein
MTFDGSNSLRQGGDLRGLEGVRWDLSTCVNPYGPPPGVIAMLRDIPPAWMTHHPWAATERLLNAYARHLRVSAHELVATHGASGAIWSLSRSILAESVTIPQPAYTEYLLAFPNATIGPPSLTYLLEQIENGMGAARTILISNPHNPSGSLIPVETLLQIAGDNPLGRLVVDESYSDFVDLGGAASIIGAPQENVAAIHSPSKFHGIPGVRAGVVWSRSEQLRKWFTTGETWAVSELDARLTEAAFADPGWESATRVRLVADREWLVDLLAPNVVGKPRANFVLIPTNEAEALETRARGLGLKVRVLGRAHGLSTNAVRISAPALSWREELRAPLSMFKR